ncbi:MAG: leucine-rich repeat protein [Eubacteriales bacterium]
MTITKNFRIKHKLTALVALVLVTVVLFCSCGTKSASAPDASGTCGVSLTWSYTSENKTLTVSGTGEMASYASSSDVPWNSSRAAIENVVISEGVTSIGDRAFYGSGALKSVSLPKGLESIGRLSFAFCSVLDGVSIPQTVNSVGESAFEACSALSSIYIPASVQTLGARAFAHCYSLKEAHVLGRVGRIEAETFLNCRSLEKIVFNTTTTADMIASDAFENAAISFDKAEFTESDTGIASVTIKYVDTDGHEMFPDVVLSDLEYGEYYVQNSPVKDGYTADKLTVSGRVYGTDIPVTVTYTPDVVETEPEETESSEPPKEQSKTTSIIAIVILAVVLIGIGVGAFLLIRSDKKRAAEQNRRGAKKNTTATSKDSRKKK